jgi:hypothetical protein
MENNLEKIVSSVLPTVVSSSKLTYNEAQNVFLTTGHVSLAGNTYFKGIRLSDVVVLVVDVGIGYAYTFLNGIRIYTASSDRKLIAERGFNTCYYSEDRVKSEAIEMIQEKLKAEAISKGLQMDENLLLEFATKLLEDVYNKNQIEVVKQNAIKGLLE